MKKELYETGAFVALPEQSPFDKSEYKLILDQLRFDPQKYQQAAKGDTYEATRASYLRIKKGGEDTYANAMLEKLFNSEKFLSFCKKVTGMRNPFLDRLQSHVFEEGGFLERHIDKESQPEYDCSFVLLLSDEYDGGEFVIHHPEKGPTPFKPERFSVIFTPSDLPHEVKTVERGRRHTLCGFLMEKEA